MSRPITFAPGEWYHCFNRGVDKRRTYMERRDYSRFQMLLYAVNGDAPLRISTIEPPCSDSLQKTLFARDRGEPLVDIGAYVLMPNHYHLLLQERVPGGVSTFMHRLSTAYTMYFNLKYERIGALFAGRFKALHINKDARLRRVINYIHGNPVEIFEPGFKDGALRDPKRLIENIANYEFGSLYDFEKPLRVESAILARDRVDEVLEETPSVHGVLDDFRTFYARSNQQAWIQG